MDHEDQKKQIQEQRKKSSDLAQQLLKVMSKVEMYRGGESPMFTEEVTFRGKLERLQRKLQAKDELHSISSRIREDHPPADGPFLSLDSENSRRLREFVSVQQASLTYLMKTLRKDLKDIDTIHRGFEQDDQHNRLEPLRLMAPHDQLQQ